MRSLSHSIRGEGTAHNIGLLPWHDGLGGLPGQFKSAQPISLNSYLNFWPRQQAQAVTCYVKTNAYADMIRYLAESNDYKVTSEYEYVTLHFKNKILKKSVYLGDFYGDPDCAIISRNEKYLVVAGCGLIIYRLEEPFSEYGDTKNLNQYFEFFREPENHWWINGLHQTDLDIDWKYFRFVAVNNEGEFIYKMNAEDFSIEKLNSSVDSKQEN